MSAFKLYFSKRQHIRGVVHLVPEKELRNPMAFSIGTHGDAAMFERLFSAIYRSHNTYCIHVDLKADFRFYRLIYKLAQCYNSHFKTNNVFLTDDRISVYWAHWTMVQADLNCMRDLLGRNSDWKFYMNLAGTEYPLKTNAEMLDQILASEYEMVGSIPSEEKFNYRHEFTQYLHLEKERVYDVMYSVLYSQFTIVKLLQGPNFNRYQEATNSIWPENLQRQQEYGCFTLFCGLRN